MVEVRGRALVWSVPLFLVALLLAAVTPANGDDFQLNSCKTTTGELTTPYGTKNGPVAASPNMSPYLVYHIQPHFEESTYELRYRGEYSPVFGTGYVSPDFDVAFDQGSFGRSYSNKVGDDGGGVPYGTVSIFVYMPIGGVGTTDGSLATERFTFTECTVVDEI